MQRYRSDAGALRQFGVQAALERRERGRKSGVGKTAIKGWECPHCHATNTHTGTMCLGCRGERSKG